MLARQSTGAQPLAQVRDELQRLMDEFLGGRTMPEWRPGVGWGPARRVFPLVNLWEDDDHLCVEAELPGFRQDQIELSVAGDELTIAGERPEPDAEAMAYRRERPSGRFARVIGLPCPVKDTDIEATLSDGVLLVELPKAETSRTRRIEVKALA